MSAKDRPIPKSLKTYQRKPLKISIGIESSPVASRQKRGVEDELIDFFMLSQAGENDVRAKRVSSEDRKMCQKIDRAMSEVLSKDPERLKAFSIDPKTVAEKILVRDHPEFVKTLFSMTPSRDLGMLKSELEGQSVEDVSVQFITPTKLVPTPKTRKIKSKKRKV